MITKFKNLKPFVIKHWRESTYMFSRYPKINLHNLQNPQTVHYFNNKIKTKCFKLFQIVLAYYLKNPPILPKPINEILNGNAHETVSYGCFIYGDKMNENDVNRLIKLYESDGGIGAQNMWHLCCYESNGIIVGISNEGGCIEIGIWEKKKFKKDFFKSALKPIKCDNILKKIFLLCN